MKAGFVYFIETADTRFVKIGYSEDPYRRMTELGQFPGSPGLRLLGCMPGTQETERWFHAKFSDDQDTGEWFRSTPELRRFIETLGLHLPESDEPEINHHGRDPLAVLLTELLQEWKRLSSGHASDMLFMTVCLRSFGRTRVSGQRRHEKTLALSISLLAELCGCDVRTIQRELKGWQERRIATITRRAQGMVSIELLYRTWKGLPAYSEIVKGIGRVG